MWLTRSSLREKMVMLVHRKLKRRRRTKKVAKLRSTGSTASTREEYVVVEVEPVTSPTLSEEGKKAMKQLVESMVLVCLFMTSISEIWSNNKSWVL